MSPFQSAPFPALMLRVCLACLAFGSAASLTAADFSVTATFASSSYTINGMGGSPTLTLTRGKTYTFAISTTSSHPFLINSAGVVNNDISSGTITYTVPMDDSDYSYVCSTHGFGGQINTVAPPSPPPPTIHILSLSLGTNLVIKSTGTNNWTVFPEFNTNLATTNWFALTVQSNNFLNGTNETYCGRPPGTNVFIRVRNQSN